MIVALYDRLLTEVEILARPMPTTGATRLLMTEKSKTFLTNQHEAIWATNTGFDLLPDGSGFIYRSQRDGWAHLYLYGMDGKLKKQLTRGDFPGALNVVRIDQQKADGSTSRPTGILSGSL